MPNSIIDRQLRTSKVLFITATLGYTGFAPEVQGATRGSPFPTREFLLPYMVFLSPGPDQADLLGKGAGKISLSVAYSNTFAGTQAFRRMEGLAKEERIVMDQDAVDRFLTSHPGSHLFFLDGEVLRTNFRLDFGLHRRVDIGVSIPLLRYTGGGMDGFIEGFHDTFGFPDDGRANFMKGEFQMALSLGNSDLLLVESPTGFGLGDISLSGKVRLSSHPGGNRTLSVAAHLKLPTGSEEKMLGSGSADYGAQLLFTQRLSRQAFHFSLGMVRLGTWDLLPELPLSDLFSVSGSYEFLLGKGVSLIGQLAFTSSPFRKATSEDLGDPSFQLTGGFRRRFPSGLTLEAAFLENPFRTNSSADFGTHLGLSYDF